MIEQNDIKALQVEGKGPAPCARFCEATAFRIEIAGWKRDQAENLANQCGLVDQITALTAERDELNAQISDAIGQIRHLDKERDALKDAARLALDALVDLKGIRMNEVEHLSVLRATNALKAVL